MLEEQLERGRQQWTIAWRRFARQWTQPQLLKLADAVMGGRYLHSSQISGFATGKLREPGPKVFIVMGELNQALAKGELPKDLEAIWKGKLPISDKTGKALDAVGCFEAFTGRIDIGCNADRAIPEAKVRMTAKNLGVYLRKQLSKADIDIIEDLDKALEGTGNQLKKIILGESIDGIDLMEAIPEAERLLTKIGGEKQPQGLLAYILEGT